MRPVKIHVPGVAEKPDPDDMPAEADLRRPPRYFNVHGLPVSLGKVDGCSVRCAQWASGRPLIFSESTVHSAGREITEQAFRDLIVAHKRGY